MTGHRVESKRGPKPSLVAPPEVTRTAPREYRDRWGTEYVVTWNGQPGDPDLRDLNPNIWK